MNGLPHTTGALVAGLLVGGLALVAMFVVRNGIIRRRLQLTLLAALAVAGLHFAGDYGLLGQFAQGGAIEKLLAAFAVINAVVTLALNPWFAARTPDRAPAIVQDAIVIALFLVVGIFVYEQDAKLLATSAIAAAVLGFALQETLGNAFAGLAIQIEKPFRVGHWITVGGHEGTVREVTWRATKIWTKNGNMVILPNSLVAREAINNYSEPDEPTRVHVEVGIGYPVPPNEARAALHAALLQVPRVLQDPRPEIMVWEFAGSAVLYRIHFWIHDYSEEEHARHEARQAIYYELHRRRIEIPFPTQVEYARTEAPVDTPERRAGFERTIAAVPVLSQLSADAHRALAQAADERLFGDGEVIVAENAPGASMFVLRSGEVVVTIGQPRREVAVIKAGGYFGEMSLLTGDPRTATVTARGDCRILEIAAGDFRAFVQQNPDVIDQLAAAAAMRRRELDETRASTATIAEIKLSLAARMRRFFGL